MRALWILAGLAALFVAVFLWASTRHPSAPREVVEDAPGGQGSEAPGLESASVLEPVTQVEERSAVQVAPQLTEALPDPRLCEIRGRFVLPGGAPAAGVPFEVDGWESNDEDVRKYGRPEHWEDLDGETDADGRLSVRFEPPRAYQFTLEAKTPGYAGAEWRWGEILAGEVVDLGEVELVRGGTIEGHIVDADGKVVLGGDWYVYADSVGLGEGEGRDETSARAWADPATGRFRVEDVMPGRVELSANDQDWTEKTIVQVRSGETVEADIVTQSREKAHGITLEAHSKLIHALSPEPEHVRLKGADGTVRSPKPSRFSFGWFVFADLEPGEYTLTVDDPRFRPWSCPVRPGAEVEVELEGTSALALRVRDGSGAAVEFYSAEVTMRNVRFSPHEFEVSPEAAFLAKGLVAGLTPGDYHVTVHAGELMGAIDVDGLASGETRVLDIVVEPPSFVSGHVRYSDGEPAKDVEVALLPETPTDPGIAGFPGGMPVSERALFEQDVAKQATDERGAFHFPTPRPGEYLVYASTTRGFEAVSEVLHVAQDAAEELELVLPRGGFVSGRILAPQGASCSGLRLWIGSKESPTQTRDVVESACELTADGHFELGPIPPGPVTVHLLLPIQRWRIGSGGTSWSAGLTNDVVLGTLELADGARVERDFEVKDFPGSVALSVLVNGEIVAGVQVELSMASEVDELLVVENGVTVSIEDDETISYSNTVAKKFEIKGETDARGEFGPALAFPGSWTVSLSDSDLGWRFTDSSPVLVSPAAESRSRIQVQVSEAILTFVDAATGAPLARSDILLLGPEGPDLTSDWPWRRQKTDAQGRASWTLASGEYRFRLGVEGDEFFLPGNETAAEERRTATVTWTLEGPLTREVRL